ncbi:hypothetical protein [Rhodobacter calidifons]|uniref:Uncharacterized protein n=1 Tax=Rhodobacter calidifons TaxID=2715277 RepID=A0ABX0G897_9RHOB|nr:hypothetical protein [Rhodobacter calidifons]NHB77510.1 hypothetical protein [Rhodobacter calidifons]
MSTDPLHLLALDVLARRHVSGLSPCLREALLSSLVASMRAGGQPADLRQWPVLVHSTASPAACRQSTGGPRARPALRVVP